MKTPLRTSALYFAHLVVAVIMAAFCFFPLGAFLPRKRRNPARKIGLPEMVIKKRRRAIKRVRNELRLD